MSIEVVKGASHKPVASAELIEALTTQSAWSGRLFIGYPLIGTSAGPHRVDALWLSETKGVVVFDLIEGTDFSAYEARQDDSANKLESRLRAHAELLSRRRLLIPIHTISFAPAAELRHVRSTDYPLANAHSIVAALTEFTWAEADINVFNYALSVVENVSTVGKSLTKRTATRSDSRAAKLEKLEHSIATLDHRQNRAVIETVEGAQRIRGLAGSGKTIALALKAAYLHAQFPQWKIAVTFNTRSLKGLYERLIQDFHAEQTGLSPDWQKIRIVNSWGAPGAPERDGLYHEFCRTHGLEYLDFGAAKARFRRGREFDGSCEYALEQTDSPRPAYDVVLVDEAQDLPPSFLRLCHAFLREPKRLVYAYDELQNLAGESMPPPEDVFGKNPDGTPIVQFDSEGSDVLLQRCYRNSRPVLVTAHSLGFGIYRSPPKGKPTGLVQMFDHPNLWEEVGYRVHDGQLRENHSVALHRPEETSPPFLEEHSPIEDLIQFHTFSSETEQAQWLANDIQENLEYEDLRHSDMIVINPDPLTTRKKVGMVRARLLDKRIRSHLTGVDTKPDVFYRSDAPSVTFTGIHRAKGNEAAMVYIINANDCQSAAFDLAHIRNRLFTAITRSKAWVRILGVGTRMEELTREYEKLKANQFTIRFRYPSVEERERLRVVHRDMSHEERRQIESRNRSLNEWIQGIEDGEIHLEDLDDEALEKFSALLQQRAR